MPPAHTAAPPSRPLERFLRLFTDVRDGEGPQLLLLAFNIFLILTSYYLMKPVREVLILDQPDGAELKSYAYAAQAVLLLVIVPLYGALAARLSRQRLINGVTLFFVACLPLFWLAVGHEAPIGLRLLPVDRHLQPDGHRAVLGLCQRRLQRRRRQAAVRGDRLRLVGRRGVRCLARRAA